MHHIHFNSIHSTQIYLKDNLVELNSHHKNILVSTDEQTFGVGQRGKSWDTYNHALAFSFTIEPNEVPTLTPLELGLIISQYLTLQTEQNIFVKWPNDLMTEENKKCGGVICQYINQKQIIAGVGINLKNDFDKSILPQHYKHGFGEVVLKENFTQEIKKKLPENIYHYILNNRIQTFKELNNIFLKRCSHINKNVEILNDNETIQGVFKNIGGNGEAIVEVSGQRCSFLTNSLKIIS
jgi:BirA family biotin operon repressor/biotin-[acetyl-CoA-carboxylase] ligase